VKHHVGRDLVFSVVTAGEKAEVHAFPMDIPPLPH